MQRDDPAGDDRGGTGMLRWTLCLLSLKGEA